jgi:hypothetical protein
MIRLRTDFNDATEDEATALAERVFVPLHAGDPIELFDADQHSVKGVVSAVADGLVYVRPDWSTWLDAPEVEFAAADPTEVLSAIGEATYRKTAGSGPRLAEPAAA